MKDGKGESLVALCLRLESKARWMGCCSVVGQVSCRLRIFSSSLSTMLLLRGGCCCHRTVICYPGPFVGFFLRLVDRQAITSQFLSFKCFRGSKSRLFNSRLEPGPQPAAGAFVWVGFDDH